MGSLPVWVRKWWDIANDRRGNLIKKKHLGGGLTPDQEKELTMLQSVADAIISYGAAPLKLPTELDKILEKHPELKPPSPEAKSLGCLARLDGHAVETNPFAKDSWLWKSWNQGWTETDRDPAAPKASVQA